MWESADIQSWHIGIISEVIMQYPNSPTVCLDSVEAHTTMAPAYLVVPGDVNRVDPRVNVNVAHQQFARLCRLQRAHGTLAVVTQPGEGIQTVAPIFPVHLHHPLLVQSPSVSHRPVTRRDGG